MFQHRLVLSIFQKNIQTLFNKYRIDSSLWAKKRNTYIAGAAANAVAAHADAANADAANTV